MSLCKDFENQCTNFLNDNFGKYATFIHKGEENSTISDILVRTNYGKSFYIEAKHSPAQSGQFVLRPNHKKHIFEYSNKNSNNINTYSEKIIEK